MAKVKYRAVLSLTEPNHQIFLRFRQDDTQTQTLSVEITADGRLFPFVGYTVEFVNVTRSDSGQPIVERVDEVYPQEARIEFTLGARSLQWLGKNKAYFSFKDADGNEVFSTQNFEYEVIHGVHKEPIKDSGYLWQVEEVLEKANQLIEDVRGTLGEEAATALAMKLNGHIEDKNNPHGVTKEQVGLGNVPNYGVATIAETKEAKLDNKFVTPAGLRSFQDTVARTYHVAYTGSTYLDGLSDNENARNSEKTWHKDNLDEIEVDFFREGKIVYFSARLKFKNGNATYEYSMPVVQPPNGFKMHNTISYGSLSGALAMWRNDKSENWTGSASVGEYASNNIFVRYKGGNGNVYISGSWITNENYPDWRREARTRISAIYGCQRFAPKNTMAAFEEAVNRKYDAVEFRVQITKDGVPVVWDNNDVSLGTNGTGFINQLTLSQLKEFNVKTDGYPNYNGKALKIPTLDEVVALLSQYDIVMTIDSNEQEYGDFSVSYPIVSVFDKYGIPERACYYIRNNEKRNNFRRNHPNAIVSRLYTREISVHAEANALRKENNAVLRTDGDYLSTERSKELIREPICSCVTGVQDQQQALDYIWRGIGMITTPNLLPSELNAGLLN